MTAILTLDNLTFEEDELDYESNGGNPVVVSSLAPIQAFDSYMDQVKIYRPNPNDINISYSASLICSRSKLKAIHSLIFKQANLVKQYRATKNLDLIKGFYFKYDSSVSGAYVWITSLSIDSSFFDINTNSEKLRCKLSLQEAE